MSAEQSRAVFPTSQRQHRVRALGICSHFLGKVALACGLALVLASCKDNDVFGPASFPIPAFPVTHDQLQAALAAAQKTPNGGFSLNMWATIVNRDGIVIAVAYTGAKEGDQWPGSRVISAQKANTANAFSLPHFALSTANLYEATQPGGTLFGLQEANPTDPDVAFGGDAADYGTPNDFMVGHRIGGTNVFGGGLALYDASGNIVGGLGLSGDASCADHNIAWKVRYLLQLDHVPAGVADNGKDDNIIYDMTTNFGHPACSQRMTDTSAVLPTHYPIGH